MFRWLKNTFFHFISICFIFIGSLSVLICGLSVAATEIDMHLLDGQCSNIIYNFIIDDCDILRHITIAYTDYIPQSEEASSDTVSSIKKDDSYYYSTLNFPSSAKKTLETIHNRIKAEIGNMSEKIDFSRLEVF